MPRTWHILLHVAVYCIYHLGLMHVKDICITIHICEAPTKRSSFAYRENHKSRKLTWGHCQPLLNGWESQVQETLKKNRKQILHQFHPTNDLKSYTYTSRAKWNICKPPKSVFKLSHDKLQVMEWIKNLKRWLPSARTSSLLGTFLYLRHYVYTY